MGYCLVVYDIPHDGTRSKVADICLDYGLDRIQYSAFLGKLIRTHQEELMLKIKRQLGKRAGNIQLYPICQKDWQQRQVIAQEQDDTVKQSNGGQGNAGRKSSDEQDWEEHLDEIVPF